MLKVASTNEVTPRMRKAPRPPRVPKELRLRLQDPKPVWVIAEMRTGLIKKICEEQSASGARRELLKLGLSATHLTEQW